jgi:hypothetical protein
MSRTTLHVIYTSNVGKCITRAGRASGFIEKGLAAVSSNQKALAETKAQMLMNVAGYSYSGSWKYVATEKIDKGEYHHFEEVMEKSDNNHCWIDVKAQ